jgi:hypothetical protein
VKLHAALVKESRCIQQVPLALRKNLFSVFADLPYTQKPCCGLQAGPIECHCDAVFIVAASGRTANSGSME